MHAGPAPAGRRGPLPTALAVLLVLAAAADAGLAVRGGGDRRAAAPASTTRAATTPAAPARGTTSRVLAAPSPASTSGAARTTTPSPAPACGVWGCPMQQRLAAAARLVATEPGRLGITVLDRRTGAVWNAGTADHAMWASSTPKLALATSLLERARVGELTLDGTARTPEAGQQAGAAVPVPEG